MVSYLTIRCQVFLPLFFYGVYGIMKNHHRQGVSMRIKKWIFVLIFFKISTGMAIVDGNILFQDCNNAIKVFDNNNYATNYYQSNEQFTQTGICLGFVSASTDIYIITNTICVPNNSTYEQYIRVVKKFLDNNPDKLSQPAANLTLMALIQAFPCKK